ncbi:MAG: phosphate acyltransferase PlsX [Trueperaceae bacterium]|nr:phosphate acyltransferase PlsX [Trueperaceae bacterium]
MTKPGIALDAMGGDRMPDAAIDGALAAVAEGVEVVLVGDEPTLRAALDDRGAELDIVHASDVIGMHEAAAEVRRRSDASVTVAARLVKEGDASALVSMGHSGATMAAALLGFGRLDGVERPAIVANIPAKTGVVTLLDVGANADCRPRMLQQFAVMGSVYARLVHGIDDPSVGLLSIGEEPGKGNELVRDAYPLLAATPGIRFHGNVEGRDLLMGTTDVVVTDGFTGNVVLKLAEGEARVLFGWIRDALGANLRSRVGGLLARPALRSVADRLDPSTYGAQPLLGVGAPAFIGHGSSDQRAVRNALRFAHASVRDELVPRLATELATLAEDTASSA